MAAPNFTSPRAQEAWGLGERYDRDARTCAAELASLVRSYGAGLPITPQMEELSKREQESFRKATRFYRDAFDAEMEAVR